MTQINYSADLAAMGLSALVTKANALTQEIEQLMQQRQTEGAAYMQQDFNQVEAQYQQSRKHKPSGDGGDY